jgi:hypothetical protein
MKWKHFVLFSAANLKVYHNRNVFIPKIIVAFRTDLHKMKIKHRIIGEYATKRCFSDLKKLTIVIGS